MTDDQRLAVLLSEADTALRNACVALAASKQRYLDNPIEDNLRAFTMDLRFAESCTVRALNLDDIVLRRMAP